MSKTPRSISRKKDLAETITEAVCPRCGDKVSGKPEKRYYCPSCEQLWNEDELTKIYECGSCGNTFSKEDSYDGDSNKCPDCARWGHILHEKVCPDCQEEEEELEEVKVLTCPSCNEPFRLGVEIKPEEIWRVPWKRGQYFILQEPYTKEVKTYDGTKVLWSIKHGEEPTYGVLLSVDRARKLISLDVWTRHTFGWGAHPESFTISELDTHWTPVNAETFQQWESQVNKKIIGERGLIILKKIRDGEDLSGEREEVLRLAREGFIHRFLTGKPYLTEQGRRVLEA